MIGNCEACRDELEYAIEYQDKHKLHYATTKEYNGIGEIKHLMIIMVNDKGEVIVS